MPASLPTNPKLNHLCILVTLIVLCVSLIQRAHATTGHFMNLKSIDLLDENQSLLTTITASEFDAYPLNGRYYYKLTTCDSNHARSLPTQPIGIDW